MPRKGIHPLKNLVRIVLSNGASFELPMAWQEPLSKTVARGPGGAADVVATRFLEVDQTNHERFTGIPSRGSRNKLGRRAKFENRFDVDSGGKADGDEGKSKS